MMVYREGKFTPLKVESRMSQGDKTMITPCPSEPLAVGSEVLLAKLPIYGEVEILP